MQLLKRVLTAVVLIPIVLAIILRAPVPVLAVVAAVVALLTVHELLKLAEAYGIQPIRLPTYIVVALYFGLLAWNQSNTPLLSTATFTVSGLFAAAFVPFAFLTIGMKRENLRAAFPAAMVSAFSFAYVVLPLAMLVQLREQWAGAYLILYLLCVVWAGDIFAYFIGKSIGRHLISPRVSPKKTWEGTVASMVASLAIGWFLWIYVMPINTWLLDHNLITQRDGYFALEGPSLGPILLLSAALNIAAQLGDLVESLIKRGAGVKDSGALLPGHGGMLDRIDALLFAAPVLWFFAAWRTMQ